jgi:prepilin-type N-terminal cleavage/methylation domain-containing protein
MKKYKGFTMIEMLITMMLLAMIFLAINSVVVNMMKTSNVASSRMIVREEGEYLAEVFRKYIRNSSADSVKVYFRENPRVGFEDYEVTSVFGSATEDIPDEEFATEIHFQPSGDTTGKVVCIGFFKDSDDHGYIVRTANVLQGPWNDYDPNWCFQPFPDSNFRKNFVSLTSDLVYVEDLEIIRDRTSANVYYTINIDMKPAWSIGGLSNYRDIEGAPKYRKSFVVQTRQLFHW